MTRLGALFWLGLALASGGATYSVKYAVQGVDDQLQRARRQIVADEQETRVLTAEWTYLNRPARLAELNQLFLHLAPIATTQLKQKIEDIPFRMPAVAVAVAVAVAAAPAAPPPETGIELARRLLGGDTPMPAEPAGLPIAKAAYRPGDAAGALPRWLATARPAPPLEEGTAQQPSSPGGESAGATGLGDPEIAGRQPAPTPVSLDALFAQVARRR
jgi:hypothetical protein